LRSRPAPGLNRRRLLFVISSFVWPSTAVRHYASLPLVVAGAGAALVPEAMAFIAERLGAVVARPELRAVRVLVLVHPHAPLSPAAARFVDLNTPYPSAQAAPRGAD
jgi:hypothetical protein